MPPAAFELPLRGDLGDLSFHIGGLLVPAAMRYFDQGYRYLCAADRPRAATSFAEASRLDPSCAICHWGEALALGPGLDSFDDPQELAWVARAAGLANDALRLLPSRSAGAVHYPSKEDEARAKRSEALVRALAVRYGGELNGTAYVARRAELDQAYAHAMEGVAEANPDAHVRFLAAEALLLTLRWDYWAVPKEAVPDVPPPALRGAQATGLPGGGGSLPSTADPRRPKPATEQALKLIEKVLAQQPEHPGALRLFVHVTERGPHDGRQLLQLAPLLEKVMPGAPRLIHLAGHVRLAAADYQGALQAHRRAVGLKLWQATPLHELEGLVYALRSAGRLGEAIKAAEELARLAAERLSAGHEQEMGCSLQRFAPQLALTLLLSGDLAGVLRIPQPPEGERYSTCIWRYARGVAYAGLGYRQSARIEVGAMKALPWPMAQEALTSPSRYGRLPASDICKVYGLVLTPLVEQLEQPGRAQDIASYRQAVEVADTLPFDEPTPLYLPPRLFLGEALLKAGDVYGARDAFESVRSMGGMFAPFANFGLRETCAAMGGRAIPVPGATTAGAQSRANWAQCAEDAKEHYAQAWALADAALQRPSQAELHRGVPSYAPNSQIQHVATPGLAEPAASSDWAGVVLALGLLAAVAAVMLAAYALGRPRLLDATGRPSYAAVAAGSSSGSDGDPSGAAREASAAHAGVPRQLSSSPGGGTARDPKFRAGARGG